jgi:hypothetical protein
MLCVFRIRKIFSKVGKDLNVFIHSFIVSPSPCDMAGR